MPDTFTVQGLHRFLCFCGRRIDLPEQKRPQLAEIAPGKDLIAETFGQIGGDQIINGFQHFIAPGHTLIQYNRLQIGGGNDDVPVFSG